MNNGSVSSVLAKALTQDKTEMEPGYVPTNPEDIGTKAYIDSLTNKTYIYIGGPTPTMTFDEFMVYSKNYRGATFMVQFMEAGTYTHTVTDHLTWYSNNYFFGYDGDAAECIVDLVTANTNDVIKFYGTVSYENIHLNMSAHATTYSYLNGFVRLFDCMLTNYNHTVGEDCTSYMINTDVYPNGDNNTANCKIQGEFSTFFFSGCDLFNTTIDVTARSITMLNGFLGADASGEPWFDLGTAPLTFRGEIKAQINNITISNCEDGIVVNTGATLLVGSAITFDTVTNHYLIGAGAEAVNKIASDMSLVIDSRELGFPYVEEALIDSKEYARKDGAWAEVVHSSAIYGWLEYGLYSGTAVNLQSAPTGKYYVEAYDTVNTVAVQGVFEFYSGKATVTPLGARSGAAELESYQAEIINGYLYVKLYNGGYSTGTAINVNALDLWQVLP